MAQKRVEQHIAVFGESGSGKTVLLSSFFGAMKETGRLADSRFTLIADKPAQGTKLLQRYYLMRDRAETPEANHHYAISYPFSLRLKEGEARQGKDPVTMVWHDYPGEWLEKEVSGETEAKRRIETFRELLGSDVALLLVDGQKLRDHAGAEERYLGSLFGSLSNLLSVLRDDILDEGQKLVQFPRVWILALSKADLLPEMSASKFKQLVTREAGGHLIELRDVIAGYVVGDEALAVGEDAVVLSSAKFEPGRIDLEARVGVDLILPLAAVLPVERHVRWATKREIPAAVARALIRNSYDVLDLLVARLDIVQKLPVPPQVRVAVKYAATALRSGLVREFLEMSEKSLEDAHRKAVEAHDEVRAILTRFQMDLEKAEQDGVLLRSDR